MYYFCLLQCLIIVSFTELTPEHLLRKISFNIIIIFLYYVLLFIEFLYFPCPVFNLLSFYISSIQPDTLGALPNLRELWLDRNQLSSLPPVSTDSFWLADYHMGHLSGWFYISSLNSCRCCPFPTLFTFNAVDCIWHVPVLLITGVETEVF